MSLTAFEEPSHANHASDIAEGHAGFADGVRQPTVDFDFDEIDRRAFGIDESTDAATQAAVVLSKILVWVFESKTIRGSLIRFVAVCGGVRPDLINRTQKQIGIELSVSKQAISKSISAAQKAFGMKFARTCGRAGRDHMRESMKNSWKRRKAAK